MKANPASCAALLGLWLLLFTVVGGEVCAQQRLPVTQRRGLYFILVNQPASPVPGFVKTGSRGYLYLKHQDILMGTFNVLDISGGRYLCRIDPDSLTASGKSHGDNITDAYFVPPPKEKKEPRPILLRGARFNPLPADNRYYLSGRAFPLRELKTATVKEVKQMLFTLEADSHLHYQAGLVPFEQVRPLQLERYIDFSDRNRLQLGTIDGKPCMIYHEGGVLRSGQLSTETLAQFKDNLYFYILVRKR
jgi:hypothetical protein